MNKIKNAVKKKDNKPGMRQNAGNLFLSFFS